MFSKWERKQEFLLKRSIFLSTLEPYELVHLDLFGPSRTKSLGGNYYEFVIVDYYTRFNWTLFLDHMQETFKSFVKFYKTSLI